MSRQGNRGELRASMRVGVACVLAAMPVWAQAQVAGVNIDSDQTYDVSMLIGLLDVGSMAPAVLTITSGATIQTAGVILEGGNITAGVSSGITLTGRSNLFNSGSFLVGDQHDGSLNITNGSRVATDGLTIGGFDTTDNGEITTTETDGQHRHRAIGQHARQRYARSFNHDGTRGYHHAARHRGGQSRRSGADAGQRQCDLRRRHLR